MPSRCPTWCRRPGGRERAGPQNGLMAEAAPLGCWVPQRACPIWGQSCSIWGQRGSVWGQSCRLGTELPSLGTKLLQSHAGMSPSCAFLESDEINVRVAARLATSFFSCCKSEAEPRSGDQSQVKALLVCQQRCRESLQQDDARSLWRSRRPWTHPRGDPWARWSPSPLGHSIDLSVTCPSTRGGLLYLVPNGFWDKTGAGRPPGLTHMFSFCSHEARLWVVGCYETARWDRFKQAGSENVPHP